MPSIIKKVVKKMWRATWPVRRPFAHRFDQRVSRIVSDTVNARMMPTLIDALAASNQRLERIEQSLVSADRSASNLAEEVDVVLSGLSREIFRLQVQLELLQRRLDEESQFAISNLSLLSETSSMSKVG